MRVWKRTRHYWFEFVHEGKRFRESSKQGDKEEAKKIAAARQTELAKGLVGLTKPKRQTVGQLLDSLNANYSVRGMLSAQNVSLLAAVRETFGAKMADEVTAEQITHYAEKRLAEEMKPATINRRLEVLRRCYKLARLTPPHITRLPEHNAREGFFTREELDKVCGHLPEDLRDFALFAYLTGMRKGEIASLAWKDVEENIIRLRSKNAKTGEARSIVIAGELASLVERRRKAHVVKSERGEVAMAATIFHRDGKPVREFRKSWATACVSAGLGKMVCPKCESEGSEHWCAPCKHETRYRGRIFHDFRRTAVRNLVRAGVPQTVAMKISGHKTVSVFQRYDICSEDDLANAMLKLEAFSSQTSNVREMTR